MPTALAAQRSRSAISFWSNALATGVIGTEVVNRTKPRTSVVSKSMAVHPAASADNRARAPDTDGCEPLSELVEEFIENHPAAKHLATELTLFCAWCRSMSDLKVRQRQCLTEASRPQSVESLALQRRLASARFERVRAADVANQASQGDPTLGRWHLHPQHVWSSSGTHPQGASPAAHQPMLLVSTRQGVQAISVSAALAPALRRLSQRGAQSLRQLLSSAPRRLRDGLLGELQTLRSCGVVAQEYCPTG